MADRKSLLSRFWPPSSSRRTQTTTSTPSQPSTPAPPTPARQSTTKARSRTQPRTTTSGKVAKPSQQTTKDEPKTSSPSRFSPPSPSSQPKRPSKPPSPSPSPKQESFTSPKGKLPVPASPSKESTQPTETISTSNEPTSSASKQKEPKPAAPQQEPEMKEEVKPDSSKAVDGPTQEETSLNHANFETKPSQLGNVAHSAQDPEPGEAINNLDSSSVSEEATTKLDAKLEEPKDVKEVVQATYTEANQETIKEVDDSGAPKLVSEAKIPEKADTPSEADQLLRENQETPAHGTASQPTKRSKNLGPRDKSAPPQVPMQKNIKDNISDFTNQMAISDKPVSVITLAGENRGASLQMETDYSKREAPIHIHRSYKVNPDECPESNTDAEENSEGKTSGDKRYMENQAMEAYVNNNAQGINNSIVFNSSIIEGNPGVHMVVTHLPKEPVQSKDKTIFPQTRKAEVNMSHAEKLTYQPTVRRRCLRGLLLERSDSDTEKPQRHGCRIGCQKGDRKNNVDVL